MTKADLVDAIYERVGLPKKDSAHLVETVFEIIKGTLEKGEPIKISGFGTFAVREKRARFGSNPQTNEAMTISARRVVAFKASKLLRKDVEPVL